mgnify:CR=1 FL=1
MVLNDVLDNLEPGVREFLLRNIQTKNVKKGAVIWRMGELIKKVALIDSGFVCVELGNAEGPETICGIHPAGSLLLTGLGPGVSPLTLRALTPLVLTELDAGVFAKALLTSPGATSFVFDYILRLAYAQRSLIPAFAGAPVEKRLAHAYWTLSSPGPDGRRWVAKSVSQADIARYVGTSREEVSRKTQLLVKEGLLVERPEGLEATSSLVEWSLQGSRVAPDKAANLFSG